MWMNRGRPTQECIAVLMELDPAEKPNIKANDKQGGGVGAMSTHGIQCTLDYPGFKLK